MQLVIPMAGLGQRFRDAGFTLPKPLIPVGGVPMVVRVIRNLPAASRVICICHPDHVRDHGIDSTLKSLIPQAEVVIAPGLTEGQACSVALAAPKLNPDEDVLVAACDSTQVYNTTKFELLTLQPSIEAIAWTFRNDPRVLVNPTAYGWIGAESDGRITRVSVKKPISDEMLKDHVITGTFWFRAGSLMLQEIHRLIQLNRRVNNEFYLDSVAGTMMEQEKVVYAFEIDKYIGWGTPDDFEDYCRWERYFAGPGKAE
jgi:NDP-sugar pyrophosphorylase family protein